MEQHVDNPVPGRGGRISGLQGFLPGQSPTALHSPEERISERIVEQNVDIPGGRLQEFRPGQSSSSSSHVPARVHEDADEPGEGFEETRSPSQKADDHEILVRLMLNFCRIVVLIRKTTTMSVARCGFFTGVGSSLSLPSSMPLVVVLNTSAWLLCLSRAAESKHLKWCDVPVLDKSLSTHYEKKSRTVPLARTSERRYGPGRDAAPHSMTGAWGRQCSKLRHPQLQC